jgi:hypothetical protein
MRIFTLVIFFVFLATGAVVQADTTGNRYTSYAGFKLGEVNLAAVQMKLGNAALIETGDAGEYKASICYVINGGVVLFIAGEINGQQHNLGAFSLAKTTDRQPCSKWPKDVPEPILEINSLRLGMSESEFSEKVGGNIHKEGGKVYAGFESRREMTKQEIQSFPKDTQVAISSGQQQKWFDVVVAIEATFNSEGLSQVEVWKTETW